MRRQQTLRASVDWSHALLSESEQVLFRRLAVFLGGFDVDAAQAVAGGGDAERFQVLDQLTLLVDKSLVVAEDTRHGTRYRLLETVRQYAQEKLHESREGDDIRGRHRDHYTAMAALLDAPADAATNDASTGQTPKSTICEPLSRGAGKARTPSLALTLASSLQPLWLTRGRIQEGLNWLGAALADDGPRTPTTICGRVRASAAKALLLSFSGTTVEPRRARADSGGGTGIRRPCARGAGADRLRVPSPRADRELGSAVLRRGGGHRAGHRRFMVAGSDHRSGIDVRAPVR